MCYALQNESADPPRSGSDEGGTYRETHRKKALSLLLTLCLTAALATTALSAPENVRETDFFRHDLYHFDGDFSELAYKHIELEPILEKLEQIRGLMDAAACTCAHIVTFLYRDLT